MVLLFLSIINSWGWSRFTIILLTTNQSTIFRNFHSKILINSKVVFGKADNMLSSRKLRSEAVFMKYNRLFQNKLKNVEPIVDPSFRNP